MKNLNIIKTITLFSAVIFLQTFSATGVKAAECSALSAGQTPAEADDEIACTVSPTSLVFTIYELALCTAAINPTMTNAQKDAICTTLFSDTSGKAVDLAPGSVIPLRGDLTMTEGTYTNGYLKMGKSQSMKTEFKFPSARTTPGSNASGTGAYCFSKGVAIDEEPSGNNSQVTCHASEFSTAANISTFNRFGDPSSDAITIHGISFNTFQMNYQVATNTLNGVSASTNLYMLDSDGTWSGSETADVTYSGDNPTLGTNDRTFIMADQTLSSPVVISPNTSALDIQFSVTGASTFAFNDSDDIFENTFNGIVFLFSAN